MGVLDDAIRQHLELKRLRGADAGEIKREEDEALGEPPRTRRAAADPVVADQPQDADPIVHQPTEAFNPAEVAEALGQVPDDAEPETEQQPVAEPQHEAEVEPDAPEPDEGPSESTEEPVAEEPESEDADKSEDAEAAESDGEADAADPLEETPEFLEDAPEHDKLWFEQKPPKDFDF